jgi:hypothetical protein
MRRFLPLVIAALLLVAAVPCAEAARPAVVQQQVEYYTNAYPWHGGYYHSAWGMPVALAISPKVEYQTSWGWGVGNTRVTRVWHQFHRNYPGPGAYPPGQFRPTPYWPSDTDQFGVYYVRGPW